VASGKVLVLDPSEVVLQATRLALEAEGYDVVTLATPFPLFETLHEERPDVLLMDPNVPELRGDKILEILRGFGAVDGIPVIFHSSLPEAEAHALAQRCGADGCVAKGLDREPLLAQVREAMLRSHVQRVLAKSDPLT
jgi:two-component system alkaline phosphatase synthesis response regulator PhoP